MLDTNDTKSTFILYNDGLTLLIWISKTLLQVYVICFISNSNENVKPQG